MKCALGIGLVLAIGVGSSAVLIFEFLRAGGILR